MLLVGVVLALAMGVLVGPAAHPSSETTAGPADTSAPYAGTSPSAKAQPTPLNRGSADVRHAPPGQPLAETSRAFGSSSLAADATGDSDQPLFLSRSWTTRCSGAVRRVLEAVAPRLGRAPPSYRVS
jgi:hypothetical protein